MSSRFAQSATQTSRRDGEICWLTRRLQRLQRLAPEVGELLMAAAFTADPPERFTVACSYLARESKGGRELSGASKAAGCMRHRHLSCLPLFEIESMSRGRFYAIHTI